MNVVAKRDELLVIEKSHTRTSGVRIVDPARHDRTVNTHNSVAEAVRWLRGNGYTWLDQVNPSRGRREFVQY